MQFSRDKVQFSDHWRQSHHEATSNVTRSVHVMTFTPSTSRGPIESSVGSIWSFHTQYELHEVETHVRVVVMLCYADGEFKRNPCWQSQCRWGRWKVEGSMALGVCNGEWAENNGSVRERLVAMGVIVTFIKHGLHLLDQTKYIMHILDEPLANLWTEIEGEGLWTLYGTEAASTTVSQT